MDKLFLTLLNMSLTGAFVIAAIILARLPLKKAPKIISYCLWAVAGFRLIFPFSIESIFSLIPFKAQPIPPDIAMQAVPRIDSGIPFVNNAVSSVLPAATPAASVNPLQIWMVIGAYVWLIGAAAMLFYGIISYVLLKRRMRTAIRVESNIYETDNIGSPFVLGIIKPKIYLPLSLAAGERGYIILHEQTHIRRHDHIVKFAAYFILCLHWFNPLVWAAFLLMGADMEMSCDERVLKEMGGDTKHDYSRSLLSLATRRRVIGGSPLAFGESGVKERVKNVLNFRKPSRVIIIAAVALVAVLSLGFAVNQINENKSFDTHDLRKHEMPERIVIYNRMMMLFHNITDDDIPLLVIEDQDGIELFYNLVKNSKKLPGVLDVTASPYGYEFHTDDVEAFLQKYRTEFYDKYLNADLSYTSRKWLDYYNPRGDGPIPYDRSLELELPEFPDTVFNWTAYEVKAVDTSGERVLFGGMPIWNVYLADLNGDMLPELCATVSFGFGLIDTRIIIYDYANDKGYDLSSRGYYNYVLSIENEQLVVTQIEFSNNDVRVTGSIAIIDGELVTFGLDRTLPESQETTPSHGTGYCTDPVQAVKAELEAAGCVIFDVFAVDWIVRQSASDGKDYEVVTIYAEYLDAPFSDAIYVMNYTMRRPADDSTAEWTHDEPMFWDGIAYGVAKYAAEQYYAETGRTDKITDMRPISIDDNTAYVPRDKRNWHTVVFNVGYENDLKSHPQQIAVLISQDGQSCWQVVYWSGITPSE